MNSCVVFGLLCFLFIGSQAGDILCPRTKTRMQWGADAPTSSSVLDPKPSLVLVKEAGNACKNRAQCATAVKAVQSHDMLVEKYPDVFCNFLIGADAQVYEGRGWSKAAFSRSSLVICMLGHFEKEAPPTIQSNTLKTFLTCSFQEDRISSSYKVQAWSDLFPKLNNPGSLLLKVVQDLPQYSAPSQSA